MQFNFAFDDTGIRLTPRARSAGLLGRLLGRDRAPCLVPLPPEERDLALAIGDLRAIDDLMPGSVRITVGGIELDHAAAAEVDDTVAPTLGLPPFVDLELRTDVEGIVGSNGFRLRCEWRDRGKTVYPRRTGCILSTSRGPQRIPGWMLQAIELAENFRGASSETDHWEALARFRRALDPDAAPVHGAARVGMTDFLSGLTVRLADSFSLSPKRGTDGALDFDPVPFLRENIDDDEVTEAQAEAIQATLVAFQAGFARRGALPAYKTGDRSFLVVSPGSRIVLDVMARKKAAPPAERDAFVRNPRPAITEAVERALRGQGALDGLTEAEEQEAIEAAAVPLLIETREFSERVIGIEAWRQPEIDIGADGGTTWLPENFDRALVERIEAMSLDEVTRLEADMRQALQEGRVSVPVGGESVPVTQATLKAVEAHRQALEDDQQEAAAPSEDGAADTEESGPLVLETLDNFEQIQWSPDRKRRAARVGTQVPAAVRTELRAHQSACLDWTISAWREGLPGVLNADEQGLGKTLQTIAFLVWLRQNMAASPEQDRRPILVVAPTSLLRNWEAEVEAHVDGDGLGHLMRLYGGSLSAFRKAGAKGRDTEDGTDKLDFRPLHEAIEVGRGDRYWILTTYTTLTNYQHSFAQIPFACAVFDEIQAIKNPTTLAAAAARAMNADFRIGLTGTPIENRTTELWAIMDQLAPGALGDLQAFREAFGTPQEDNMARLHRLVFCDQSDTEGRPVPALAIRRLKEEAATDLPTKTRALHPRLMPEKQAIVYDMARLQLGKGRGALAALHHIRSVSVHPDLNAGSDAESFISASARLQATFDILDRVRAAGERALVFIESIRMQHRFAELACQRYGLNQVDIINGNTSIPRRQEIVTRFQRHLKHESGFDLLILGPKAAGTGLTLTAATHVIHLSRWWNPAVEEQCNDRVHRIGQTRPVQIHVPMAIHPGHGEGSFDCLLHSLMQRKRRLATAALWPMGDTGSDVQALQAGLNGQASTAGKDPLTSTLEAMYARDGNRLPQRQKDGSFVFE